MAAEGWTSRHVTVEGREVFVRSGPEVAGAVPIVHVHGFAISGTYLLPTAERLAHRATAVVPDLPGYGRSEEWGHPLGIPALAWALLSTLDALGLDRVVLLGNSMGGPVSLGGRARHPDRVAGVVLASPAGGVHNQPFGRALTQLARDAVRESPRMARVAVPDYVRFGPVNALQLFAELARFPSLERVLRVPCRRSPSSARATRSCRRRGACARSGRSRPARDRRRDRGRPARHELQPPRRARARRRVLARRARHHRRPRRARRRAGAPGRAGRRAGRVSRRRAPRAGSWVGT